MFELGFACEVNQGEAEGEKETESLMPMVDVALGACIPTSASTRLVTP